MLTTLESGHVYLWASTHTNANVAKQSKRVETASALVQFASRLPVDSLRFVKSLIRELNVCSKRSIADTRWTTLSSSFSVTSTSLVVERSISRLSRSCDNVSIQDERSICPVGLPWGVSCQLDL